MNATQRRIRGALERIEPIYAPDGAVAGYLVRSIRPAHKGPRAFLRHSEALEAALLEARNLGRKS